MPVLRLMPLLKLLLSELLCANCFEWGGVCRWHVLCYYNYSGSGRKYGKKHCNDRRYDMPKFRREAHHHTKPRYPLASANDPKLFCCFVSSHYWWILCHSSINFLKEPRVKLSQQIGQWLSLGFDQNHKPAELEKLKVQINCGSNQSSVFLVLVRRENCIHLWKKICIRLVRKGYIVLMY